MSTPCDDLHAFFDGELPEPAADAFRLHLATCPDCPEQLETFTVLDALVSEVLAWPRRPTATSQDEGRTTPSWR